MGDAGFPGLERGSVITVGSFDGVHLGHREILARLRARAVDRGLPDVVLTFSPHPLAVVNPAAAPRLLSPGTERIAALASNDGPERAIVVAFSADVAALGADQFVRRLVERYGMRELIVGYDHRLGHGRQGDTAALEALGRRLAFEVHVVEARTDALGVPISSSAIRRAVAYGELERARDMLGRPYDTLGLVVPGANRGRSIGVPTINLSVPKEKLWPPDGVYAVRVTGRQGRFGGMMNLGARPTFGEFERIPEIHLFEASGDWYGDQVWVEFVTRLRDTVRFAGVDELVAQLSRDSAAARFALTQA